MLQPPEQAPGTPLVSVIVPNYNHAEFLEQRLQSVFSQTFQDFEVIILDDRSTDQSAVLLEPYRHHPKVSRLLLNDVNSGSTFRQWIKGIRAAAGKYIWIAESDDWCEPTFLQTMVDALTDHPSCVVAYCQSYCVSGNQIRWQSSHPLLAEFVEGKTFIRDYMLFRNSIFNASMGVWRKECFEKISPEFTTYKFCGDWLFWIELSNFGEVFISGRLLNYFRKHDKDVSGKAYKMGLNFTEELKMVHHLHATAVIDADTYLSVLRQKYLEYRLGERTLPEENRQQVESAFYATPAIRQHLRKYFFRWNLKHQVKTLLTGALFKTS